MPMKGLVRRAMTTTISRIARSAISGCTDSLPLWTGPSGRCCARRGGSQPGGGGPKPTGPTFCSRQGRPTAASDAGIEPATPEGSADCGTVPGDADEPPLTSPCAAIVMDAASAGNPPGPNRTGGLARTSDQEVSMIITRIRLRLRPAFAVAIAFLPLILAACNNGGSSGY